MKQLSKHRVVLTISQFVLSTVLQTRTWVADRQLRADLLLFMFVSSTV